MVSRWDPDKQKMIDKIILPVKNVTCCSFAGEKLDKLYITTGSIGSIGKELEMAGGLFVCHPGVKGRTANRFKG
jgi:sugar lactone lactonase YvrE